MVFGFGEGKIELSINKTLFSFGETIEGKLSLQLKKEKLAKKLRITLVAEQTQTRFEKDRDGRTVQKEFKNTLFSNETILDGEKTYIPPGKEYEFKIQLPGKDIMPAGAEAPSGMLGTFAKTAKFMAGQSSQIKWFIEAALDIPKGIDVNKKIQISVQ